MHYIFPQLITIGRFVGGRDLCDAYCNEKTTPLSLCDVSWSLVFVLFYFITSCTFLGGGGRCIYPSRTQLIDL